MRNVASRILRGDVNKNSRILVTAEFHTDDDAPPKRTAVQLSNLYWVEDGPRNRQQVLKHLFVLDMEPEKCDVDDETRARLRAYVSLGTVDNELLNFCSESALNSFRFMDAFATNIGNVMPDTKEVLEARIKEAFRR